MHRQEHCCNVFVCVCLPAHSICVPVLLWGVRCVRLGARDAGESVKSRWVGDLKGGQKAPNWTSETGGGEADCGEDNLPQ